MTILAVIHSCLVWLNIHEENFVIPFWVTKITKVFYLESLELYGKSLVNSLQMKYRSRDSINSRLLYHRLILFEGESFVHWIVKTFPGYTVEDYTKQTSKVPFHSIIIPSVECLKIFMVKILRIEKFSPLKINPLYGTTNLSMFSPTNAFYYMVWLIGDLYYCNMHCM